MPRNPTLSLLPLQCVSREDSLFFFLYRVSIIIEAEHANADAKRNQWKLIRALCLGSEHRRCGENRRFFDALHLPAFAAPKASNPQSHGIGLYFFSSYQMFLFYALYLSFSLSSSRAINYFLTKVQIRERWEFLENHVEPRLYENAERARTPPPRSDECVFV